MSAAEHHPMPNGTEIFYRDSDHAYWERYDVDKGTCSGRVPGISTVAKNDGDTNNDGLLNWAARLAYEGVAWEAKVRSVDPDEDGSWLATGEDILAVLTTRERLWWQVRDAKGKVGTLSHDVLKTLAEGAMPIVRSGYDRAVVDWWEIRQPEIMDTERVVYSAEHGFAGRFDIRAIIRGECDAPHAIPELVGKRILGDAKTSGFINNGFHIQAAGYELAARECGVGGSDVRVILQLREDGSWHEWAGHAEPLDFLIALATDRLGKRVGAKARKDWRDWKQATEAVAA